MSTPLSQYAQVSVQVQSILVQQTDFGQALLFGIQTGGGLPSSWVAGQRTQSYPSYLALTADFAIGTKFERAAFAYFQGRTGTSLKVGLQISGDASIGAALAAIDLYDSAWYGMFAINRLEADLLAIAAYMETTNNTAAPHIYMGCSEESDVITAGSSDVSSSLQALGYNRTAYFWHWQGGVDVSGTATSGGAISGGLWTVDQTAHGLNVGDPIVFSGITGVVALNGTPLTVNSVPTTGTFTIATTLTGTPAGSISYFARYTFPEARWMGNGLSAIIGAEDWAFKQLVGQTPSPTANLNQTQQLIVIGNPAVVGSLGKGGNVYTTLGGSGATQVGRMVSGRFIDIQIGIDWLTNQFQTGLIQQRLNAPKIPYTQQGINSLMPTISSVCDAGVSRQLLGPITTSTSGETRIITMPQMPNIPSAQRSARILPSIAVTVQFQGAIVDFTLNAAALF